MIRVLFVCFCSLVFQQSTAQYPKLPGEIDTEVSLFDDKIISKHKIRIIHAEYSYKYDLQVIKDDKKEVTYFFNEKGLVERIIEQRHYHNKSDSISYEYYYNKLNSVTTYVKTESKNHTVMFLDLLDDFNYRVSFYLIPKELKWNDNINSEFLIWSDSVFINGSKFQYYNLHDLNYKNVMFNHSQLTKEESISIYSKDGRLSKKVTYTFEENGELSSIAERNLNPHLFDWKKTFKYKDGLFSEERFYKEDIQQYLRKITCHENGLPELDIKRNDITKRMTIIQFVY